MNSGRFHLMVALDRMDREHRRADEARRSCSARRAQANVRTTTDPSRRIALATAVRGAFARVTRMEAR